jgi:F-type H+-transporting ATPase subunit b
MEEREQKMRSQLNDAEQKKKDADRDAESSRKILQDLSEKSQEMNTKAAEEAQVFQKALMQKGRESVETSKTKWYVDFERQKESILADLSRHAGEGIYATVRRALQDLADENLEHQILNTFIKRLQNMSAFENEKIIEFYKTSGQQIVVKSTFEIPEEMRQRIKEIVHNQTGKGEKMQFRIMPELICGVEMSTHDTRIGWSIASYLNALEVDLREALTQRISKETQNNGAVENGSKRQ